MTFENKQDIYTYQFLHKRSIHTPLDHIIREVEGEDEWVQNVLQTVPDIFDNNEKSEIISDVFKAEVIKQSDTIIQSFKKGLFSINQAIWLLSKVPELAAHVEMIDLVYQWVYEGVENQLEMYEQSLLTDFMNNKISLEELPYMFTETYKPSPIPYLCNNRAELLLWVIKNSYSKELLQLYTFKKCLYTKVLLHFALSQTNLENSLTESKLFQNDLLKSYLLLCSDNIISSEVVFNQKIHIEDLHAFESEYGEDETSQLIHFISNCNMGSERALPFLLEFIDSKSTRVKEKAVEAVLSLPKGYKHLITDKYKADKFVKKQLKKIYTLESSAPCGREEVLRWLVDKKRKKNFSINHFVETSDETDILFLIRDLFISGKVSKFMETLDALAYNISEEIPSILYEIQLCSKSSECRERCEVLLNWIRKKGEFTLSECVKNSFLQRDVSTYSREYTKYLAQHENDTKELQFDTPGRSAGELTDLIGKRAEIKEVKQLIKQNPIISTGISIGETVFSIPIKKFNLICKFETSLFNSHIAPGDYLTDFPEEFKKVELLSIDFYPHTGEKIDFMFFANKQPIEQSSIDSKLISTIYMLLSRCFSISEK